MEQNTAKLLKILINESVIENLAERVATIVAEKINNRLDDMTKLLADKELGIQQLEQKVQKMTDNIDKLGEAADNMEQSTISGDRRITNGEDTDKKVVLTVNEHMQFNPHLALEELGPNSAPRKTEKEDPSIEPSQLD